MKCRNEEMHWWSTVDFHQRKEKVESGLGHKDFSKMSQHETSRLMETTMKNILRDFLDSKKADNSSDSNSKAS